MSFPFRRILSPIDFEDVSPRALEVAGQVARQNDGTVVLLHVVPMVVPPSGVPLYVEMYQGQEETAREKLREIASRRLQGIKHEVLTQVGDPAGTIIRVARRTGTDLIVMSTHARRGVSRLLLGSVAEMVLREAPCPVLGVRRVEPDKNLVSGWMSSSPVTAAPEEKLSVVQARMREGNFRTMPVVDKGRLVGIVTDRDLRSHTGFEEHTEVRLAMSEEPATVAPTTALSEAVRLMLERKIDALPVVEDGELLGLITVTDVMRSFVEAD